MNKYFEIFWRFFNLGLVSFGGPAAHIGYFNQTFVQKLSWLSQQEYGQIVALSQFLPGPGSSQVGFAIGYKKAGLFGALTAFIAFTLPSIVLMLVLANISQLWHDNLFVFGVIHGLKLLAVVVVADAVLTMFNSFCTCQRTKLMASCAAIFLFVVSGIASQMMVIALAALVGAKFLVSQPLMVDSQAKQGLKVSWLPIIIFAVLFLLLPMMAMHENAPKLLEVFSEFFYAGSLVFGGGHVVLPILQELLADNLTTDTFLTGYAAAQAVPGPMFTLATYLGFHLTEQTPILGALIATLAVFLPGFLLMLGFLKHWHNLAQTPKLAGAMQGVNAAVVGLLFSALYQPVFNSAVSSTTDMAFVVLGFVLLKLVKLPIVYLVLGFAASGALMAWM